MKTLRRTSRSFALPCALALLSPAVQADPLLSCSFTPNNVTIPYGGSVPINVDIMPATNVDFCMYLDGNLLGCSTANNFPTGLGTLYWGVNGIGVGTHTGEYYAAVAGVPSGPALCTLTFTNAPEPVAAQIPTLSEWTTMALASLVALLPFALRRRKPAGTALG